LAYGARLCLGVLWPVSPSKPIVICRDCLRRLTTPVHAWQKWLEPAPAKHEHGVWVCEKRINK
jgi:hypothetical protein